MNGEQAERFQELLEEACDHHIEYDGGTIATKIFVDEDNKLACPLGCLFGRTVVGDMATETNQLLDTTTVTEDELWAFIFTFDGAPVSGHHKNFVSAILIGKALRAKYIERTSAPKYIEEDTQPTLAGVV